MNEHIRYAIEFEHNRTKYFWRTEEYGFGSCHITEEFSYDYLFVRLTNAEDKLDYVSKVIDGIKDGSMYPDSSFNWTKVKDLKIVKCKIERE